MNLSAAKTIADSLVERLTPYCDRVMIAGSIRREKPEVKDIEIVAAPKLVTAVGGDLFNPKPQHETSVDFIRAVKSLGVPVKGQPTGRYTQITLPEGVALDLFMPTPGDYWRQFAIRTGSSDYAARKIAGGWKARGWCGSDEGLRLIDDCVKKSAGWKCINPNAQLPPEWESEEAFFEWLGIPWIHPRNRLA